jgi:hypothetical protein
MLHRNIHSRRYEARKVRDEAARIAYLRPHPLQISNGEEGDYRTSIPSPNGFEPNFTGNYSKGLAHNYIGEVNPDSYRSVLRAIQSGDPNDFERIQLGIPNGRKLINPQAGLAFDLEGPDAQSLAIPPAPRIDSAEASAEMAELYWMALLRDVNFTSYGADAGPVTTTDAVTSLNTQFSDFRGPKQGGFVTINTLFRGFTPGDLTGPYVSQFLLKTVDFGTLRFTQRQRTTVPNLDYMLDFPTWLNIQNGQLPAQSDIFDPTRRYIRNMRDLATYVHFDQLYEAYFNACLILLSMEARFDPGNLYAKSAGRPGYSQTQLGFGTFGGPHILSLITEVATRALKAVWYQKWHVHRRLRPEAFGGLIHVHQRGLPAVMGNPAIPPGRYPMINNEILASNVLNRINAFNIAKGFDTYLLPQAFPEGSPTHPAYGAGHATVAGACVSILKAWFDESDVFDPNAIADPNPVMQAMLREARRPKVPNAPGTFLVNYTGGDRLTVGGELNKLAANIAIGRNMAGVHWRSDYTESLKLGEAIAIGILEEQKLTYNEPASLSLTRFDGTTITI